jgi:hypothetical protein
MRRRLVLAVSGALLATAAAGAAVVARAADAPAADAPAAPTMLPKLDHPFVRALLGEWDVTATGPMGESRARSTMRSSSATRRSRTSGRATRSARRTTPRLYA